MTEIGSVLIVDDDPAIGTVLGALLAQAGFGWRHATSAQAALELLETQPFDAVIADVRMPGMDGFELLRRIIARWPELPVLMLTAHSSVPLAVEAMKSGAADFLAKPFDREELLFALNKALVGSKQRRSAAPLHTTAGNLVGDSDAMRELDALIAKTAASSATVLIRGESGTGKELVARAIHERSARHAKPFVAVHCGALPDTLLESELFGHEKGAFTGAVRRKPGRIELAHEGTLFLDEIGDVTPGFQIKLLRVLQERTIERVGGTDTVVVNVRFIAATHRDLSAMVADGSFRADLFYRLSVVPLWLPALRTRGSDVERLARHFCNLSAQQNGQEPRELTAAALDALRAQPWPGNVRQLQNLIERLVVLGDGSAIDRPDVERELARETGGARSDGALSVGGALDEHRRRAEREALVEALRCSGNNRSLAARVLGISRRTLYTKIEELGIA